MLHEILLALSGQPSPLFEDSATKEGGGPQDDFLLLSPPEKALLSSLAYLSRLHQLLRRHTARISSTHPSTISRAVSTTISTEHLGKFQKKILEVEKAILTNDATYVGGYGIVPLSSIASEFSPWVRRMEWLWSIARFMLPEGDDKKTQDSQTGACTGAGLINHLRNESHTGYLDISEMTVELVKVAEMAWMRQLSMWVLYGQLPSFGQQDFFIQAVESMRHGSQRVNIDFTIRPELMPTFVSPSTAASILFIGKSLNHIKTRGTSSVGVGSMILATHLALHGDYVRHLSSLSSPISSVNLAGVISEIRLSLSQTALLKLLPLPKILETLSLLHSFLLLGRGEFPMALVSYADERGLRSAGYKRDNKQLLGGLAVKEGEVTAVLAKVWAELYSLQNEEDPVDDELDLARDLLRLRIKGNQHSHSTTAPAKESNMHTSANEVSDVRFDDLLFGTPTALSLEVHPPVDLFLGRSDLSAYSRIHAYLLGIRRAQIRLGQLWKFSSLRRTLPAPWGPPLSNKPAGQRRLKEARNRESARSVSMRIMWTTASTALFVLSELTSYFQGEVINGSWLHFKEWLDPARPTSSGSSRPGTSSSAAKHDNPTVASRPGTQEGSAHQGGVAKNTTTPHDPESITAAHRTYLASITQSLLLTDTPFTQTLRTLLTQIDHFIALISRLATVQQNLDLENDEGVFDSLANYVQDEKSIWRELKQARVEISERITELVSRLRDIDDNRLGDGATKRAAELSSNGNVIGDGSGVLGGDRNPYIPRKPAGVDRLLMKLDFGNLGHRHDSAGYDFGAGIAE